ncbi:transporter substrate-binding domain-containing protein [Collinsella sp. zg1085]|uniref:substrate-binding periplasmic protein n=1 Tax=Collinsella sp. zg1085 TaxID=2844380 RepID=UPI001C0B09BA|nr:transporter substrate-binding domain-containing protein [Collinsella sp. zg1085]QWT17369.1 transporter substrate-binding domain-containing protein [Collinsella sp. zg1085]
MLDLRRYKAQYLLGVVLVFLSVSGLSGCALLTPARSEVPADTVRAKLKAPTLATDKVLTIGIPANDAPQVATDSQGKLTGYYVDLGLALAKKLGLKASFMPGSSPDKAGLSGGPDIYLGASATGRYTTAVVTSSILQDAPALFAKKGQNSSVGAAQLQGASIAVQGGSAAQDALTKTGIVADEVIVTNINDAFKAVAEGRASYALCRADAGAFIARTFEDMHFVGTLGSAEILGFAARTGSSELIAQVSQALSALESDGTIDAIYQAWYGALPRTLNESLVNGIMITNSNSSQQSLTQVSATPSNLSSPSR